MNLLLHRGGRHLLLRRVNQHHLQRLLWWKWTRESGRGI
uniref:Uncharacterized protein n=1 Tax=Rhizophora mucronata TaxID=61149 RepID=A0A2P2QKG3_RHIMU